MTAAAATIETRRTDWVEFAGIDGSTHYRIWTQFDGLRFFQRHEWRNADGTIQTDDWIPGTYKHVTGGKPVTA